jgi:hypothetical protein
VTRPAAGQRPGPVSAMPPSGPTLTDVLDACDAYVHLQRVLLPVAARYDLTLVMLLPVAAQLDQLSAAGPGSPPPAPRSRGGIHPGKSARETHGGVVGHARFSDRFCPPV